MHDVVEEVIGAWPMQEGTYEVRRSFDPPLMLNRSGDAVPVPEIVVRYGVRAVEKTVEISATGLPELILRTLDGTLDRVITDSQLQQYEIGEDGIARRRADARGDNSTPAPGKAKEVSGCF